MKTSTKYTALFLAALLLSLNVNAIGFEFDEEVYIDDIPANIEKVIENVRYEKAITVDFMLEDEEYIDDIPSNIENNLGLSQYSKAISQDFSFDEEAYIDDIPTSIVINCNS